MFDAIVVGLGGMGSAAAYHLAGRGRKVLGLERFQAAHDQGSSHGRSRIIRHAYFEHPDYVPLLTRSYELWDKLQRDSAIHVLTMTGGLMVGRAQSAVVSGSLGSAREHGLAHDYLDADEIRARWPVLAPDDETVGLYEDNAGVLGPEVCVMAHLETASRAGAELHFNEPVESWSASGSGVKVTTVKGTHEAGRLIIAAGAWNPGFLEGLAIPMIVERQIMYWFDPVGGTEPFEVGRFPIYIFEEDDGVQFYGFPAQDGPDGGIKVAFFRLEQKATTPQTIDREVREAEIEYMRRRASQRIPAVAGPLLDAKTCMYTTTPDEHFVIGLHPEHDNVAIAAGFSGHGFKFCSVVGEILADLATEGTTSHPIGLFDPTRFSR